MNPWLWGVLGFFVMTGAGADPPRRTRYAATVPQVLEELASPANISCGDTADDQMNALFRHHFGDADTSDRSRHHPCSEFFSLRPPGSLELFRSRVEPVDYRFMTDNWMPYCSFAIFASSLRDHPGRNVRQIFSDSANRLRRLDLCEDPQNRSGDRSGVPPLPSTPPLRSVTRYTAVRVQEVEATFRRLRDEARDICCHPSETECRNTFSRVSLRWCSPSNEGICNEAFVGLSNSYGWGINPRIFTRQRSGQGGVSAEPHVYINAASDYLIRVDDIHLMLTHELGHVCSSIVQMNGINRGISHISEDSARLQNYFSNMDGNDAMHPALRCSPAHSSVVYELLYRKVGASAQTVSCMLDMVERYPRERFSHHQCRPVCQRQHFEEAFAELFSFRMNHSPNDIYNWLDRTCRSARDREHPLTTDLLRCLLLTPSFRTQLESGVGCRR